MVERESAAYSSVLAWRSPWTEEAGRLQSTGLERARHPWETKPSPPPPALKLKGSQAGQRKRWEPLRWYSSVFPLAVFSLTVTYTVTDVASRVCHSP